jgi:CheY-like chemotaxis protein
MKHAQVLIVDDDSALLEALAETLQLRMGSIRVDTCDSPTAALERLAATDYDAIVADIKMPGLDGLQLLARIHRLRPRLRRSSSPVMASTIWPFRHSAVALTITSRSQLIATTSYAR